jgi:hypothetical protein
METKKQFVAFINKLPINQKKKDNLLDILENEGVDELKVVLRVALEESALKTSFKENVLAADGEFQKDMEGIESDAMELRGELAKELDAKQLEDLKNQIKG